MDHIKEVRVEILNELTTVHIAYVQKIRLRLESREKPIKYSGVKQMNRHELEIEKSLLKGTEGSHDLNHLVVAGHVPIIPLHQLEIICILKAN